MVIWGDFLSRNKFIQGSIIMILINIFTRTIGFAYEVLLSKHLGAEAMGWFQMVMSVLMVFLVFTISGIPSSITKLVAEEHFKGNRYNVEKIYKSAIFFNLILANLLCLLLLNSASFISEKVLGKEDLLLGIYLLIPAILIISLSNILRAYFYGIQNMIIPSVSQTIEHFSRFVLVIGAILYFSPIKPIYGTMLAILGISIGEFFDLAWSLIHKRKLTKIPPAFNPNGWGYGKTLKKLLLLSLPLTLSSFFNVGLNFLNSILIPSRLVSAGYTNSLAMASFGRITGMAMPLINLPFLVTSSLVVNIIPSLSEQLSLNKRQNMKSDIYLAVKITLLISIPLTFLYVMLAEPISIFLYKDLLAANYIKIMGYGTGFLALQHTFSGILFGLNKQNQATSYRMLAMLIRVFLIYTLVGNPRVEIYGYFIAFYISNILIITLDFFTLKRTIEINFNYRDLILKPVLASLFMTVYLKLTVFDLDNLKYVDPLAFAFSLFVAFLSYVFILIVTKALPKDGLKEIFNKQL